MEQGRIRTIRYGSTTISGAANTNALQFTGRENDGTGLSFYRARYYDPRLQRFISEDPLGPAGGVNLFTYAENQPIAYTDPLGLKPSPNFGPGGAGGAGGAGWAGWARWAKWVRWDPRPVVHSRDGSP
jgi:RHS repeat-associated protein